MRNDVADCPLFQVGGRLHRKRNVRTQLKGTTTTMEDGTITVPPANRTGAWSAEMIRSGIASEHPLVESFLDIEVQVQPNGFDLTLASVAAFTNGGRLAVDTAGRVLPEMKPLVYDTDGWLELPPGPYQITCNEIVRLPLDAMALGRPRSSLNRSGVTIHSAVWDAGYVGRSTALLSVLNPAGFAIQRDARLLQLVFFSLATPALEGYQGAYQHENLAPRAV